MQYDLMGVPLIMDGRRRSPRTIARACTAAEDGGYMRDYVEDTDGRIRQLCFNYIRDPWKRNPRTSRERSGRENQ